MSRNQQIERALNNALACREDRKRAEESLATLKRKEQDAVEQLQALVHARETQGKAP